MGSLDNDQEIHVLMVTLPLQGHINPMLKFAKRLMPKGVHVTLATTSSARDRLLATVTTDQKPKPENINDSEKPNHPSLDLEFIPDGLSPNSKDDKHLLEYLRSSGHKSLSDLITNLSSRKKFSCVISSPFTPWVPGVAFEHNIPCAVLWIQACAVFSIYYRHFTSSISFPDLNDPKQTVEIPALPLLEVRDLPSFMLSHLPHFQTLISDFVQSLEKVKWVLANSYYELEPEIIESMACLKPIISIGPLVSPFLLQEEDESVQDGKNLDMWKSEDSCMGWLDEQTPSSVIYISFGSIIESTENQIQTIATALKNLSKPFLWVIRPLEKATSVEILQEMIEQGVGKVVSWGPQERILSHLAVSCFVTHCGWNSALETVVAGKPVVAYPSWTDQPIDARLLVDVFRIGVRMRDGESGLVAEEVERCLHDVTSEEPTTAEMRQRAEELSKAARKAVARGGSSSQNIERFLREIAEN